MPDTAAAIAELERAGRIISIQIAGERRDIAVEDAARYRDGLGTPLPAGIPQPLLEPVRDPAGDLALRFARTHGPFTVDALARRFGLGTAIAESLLTRLTESGRLVQGEFRPGGVEREWVDADVLRRLRSRSLARLRREVEPVSPDALGRFLVAWHGVGSMRRGPEALLDAIEQLQGAPLPFSVLERDVLPARVAGYQPSMLDTLMAAGEVVWAGVESLGERDGRIALYLTDHMPRLRPPSPTASDVEGRSAEILSYLKSHGASFFSALHEGSGGGFPGETVDALWDLVWKGLVTNDTLHALRAYVSETSDEAAQTWAAHAFQVSTARASDSGRPMVARGRAACVEVLRDGVEHRDREPVARTPRCRHARNDHARTGRRWLFDRLPGPQSDGGCGTRPPRVLRGRPRRRAIRDAGRTRPVAIAARRAREFPGCGPVRNRPGVSLRFPREVARERMG